MKLLKHFIFIAGAIAILQTVLNSGLIAVHPTLAAGLTILAAALVPHLFRDEN